MQSQADRPSEERPSTAGARKRLATVPQSRKGISRQLRSRAFLMVAPSLALALGWRRSWLLSAPCVPPISSLSFPIPSLSFRGAKRRGIWVSAVRGRTQIPRFARDDKRNKSRNVPAQLSYSVPKSRARRTATLAPGLNAFTLRTRYSRRKTQASAARPLSHKARETLTTHAGVSPTLRSTNGRKFHVVM